MFWSMNVFCTRSFNFPCSEFYLQHQLMWHKWMKRLWHLSNALLPRMKNFIWLFALTTQSKLHHKVHSNDNSAEKFEPLKKKKKIVLGIKISILFHAKVGHLQWNKISVSKKDSVTLDKVARLKWSRTEWKGTEQDTAPQKNWPQQWYTTH